VLDPAPPRHLDPERLERIERGELASTIHEPVRIESVRHLMDGDPEGLERAGEWLFSPAWLDELRTDLARRLDAADPLDPGIAPLQSPWAESVEPLLGLERRGAKLYRPGLRPSLGARSAAADELEGRLGLEPVRVDDRELGRFLEQQGSLVRVGDGLAVSRQAYEEARQVLVAECESGGSITLARFRDLLGVGRRTAQLLLERFDADGLTRRTGDARTLRRSARAERRV
jgi:hypothetical protein